MINPIIMITDNNFYVSSQEYNMILDNPRLLPRILSQYSSRRRTIDITYAMGRSDLADISLINKKQFYCQITPEGIITYDSNGKIIGPSRREYHLFRHGMKPIDLRVDDPDYTYTMNLILKMGDYGPVLD